MSNITRNLVLTAGIASALVLGACGTPAASTSAAATSAAATSAAAESTTSAEATSAATDSAAQQTTSAASTSAADANAYENEYFQIAYEPAAGWILLDSSSAGQVNSNFSVLTDGATVIMAASPNDGSGSGIVLAREDPSAASANVTAADHLKANADVDKAAMEATGLKVEVEDASITLGSQEIPAIVFTLAAADGSQSYCLQSCMKVPEGDFLDIIVLGSSKEDINNTVSYLRTLA